MREYEPAGSGQGGKTVVSERNDGGPAFGQVVEMHCVHVDPSPNPLCWPVGTNLLTDPQARAMLEYVLKGAPVAAWGDRGSAAS